MNAYEARVMGLQRAAWTIRRASSCPSALPFALAMMTDERLKADIVSLIERIPAGPPILIVFRHHSLKAAARRALAARAYAAARSGGHVFVVAGGGLPSDGAHNISGGGFATAAVHSIAEGLARRSQGAMLGFVSPVFATRSHPGARPLGPARASAIARAVDLPCFALGGIDTLSAARLRGTPFQGIAAVGAFDSA